MYLSHVATTVRKQNASVDDNRLNLTFSWTNVLILGNMFLPKKH
jgi:hypothetical protein